MFNKAQMVRKPGTMATSLTKGEAIGMAVEQGRLIYKLKSSGTMNVEATVMTTP
jgi:hypothetical protein